MRLSFKVSHIFFILLCFVLFFSCSQNKLSVYEDSFTAMDTVMNIRVWSDNQQNALLALNEARQKILELDSLFSVTDSSSEVYKINHSESYPVSVSFLTYDLLEKSIQMSEKTSDDFNFCLYPVTSLWGFTQEKFHRPETSEIEKLLPLCNWQNVELVQPSENTYELNLQNGMMIDFGGIAKGFAGDEVIKILQKYKIEHAVLDLGGNIQTLGYRYDGNEWSVGIKNPSNPEEILGAIKVNNKAVITSAGYERFFIEDGKKYSHIFDGNTGFPAESDILSATIIAENGWYADALSTAFYVMGSKKSRELWEESRDFDYIIVTNDNSVLTSCPDKVTF